MNSWSTDIESDNYKLRSICINNLSLDIISLAETHFRGREQLHLAGYKW